MRKRIISWALSRPKLPRWFLFILDSIVVFFSAILAFVINNSLSYTIMRLGSLAETLSVYTLCFMVGFVIFRSYDVEIRRLSYVNLVQCLGALLFGVVVIMMMRVYAGVDRIFLEIRFRDLMLMTLIALVLMWSGRILGRFFFDYLRNLNSKSNIYGLNEKVLLDMELKDLLPREPVQVDFGEIERHMSGRRIMVTGAAGSIGSELVKLLAACNPGEMILIDQAETPMHQVRMMMAHEFPWISCQTIVTDICHRHRMEAIFKRCRPEIIFHAAAYKHVPMMEDNPVESVLNNIVGTKKLADLSVLYGVRQFVMISTDKAVNPTNIMGCSKRICEIYCQSLSTTEDAKNSGCQFITTRFGNVLGSNGSVIPIFREQIRKGGPVMVTHPEIVRYFMLIPEACSLVLAAATIGKSGEIYLFDMGQQVKIVDLAKRMIELSGRSDIEISFTGLRPGEKLYEEVIDEREIDMPTSHPKIKKAKVRQYDFATVEPLIESLIEVANTYNQSATVEIMKTIVPEYDTVNPEYKI